MNAQPFRVTIPQETLDDLQLRLKSTRWLDGAAGDWDYGTSLHYLKELVNYWQTQFDWRRQEEAINRFSQFRTQIDGLGIHFIHERGKGPNPFPILLTHGYPDSFLRFAKIIPMLADPGKFGGDPVDSFHVIAPSLPGYGFSDKPAKSGTIFHVGDLWSKLMDQLGYKRFAAHGGDWGSTVTEQLARSHSDSVVGVHLTDVPFAHIFQKPDDLSSREKKYLAETEEWQKKSGAYAMIQGTRPQSLAHGLNDSPAGLAAWLIEKFREWSDCGGNVEKRFTKDELLTNAVIYWATGTINSSFLPYYDYANAGALTWIGEKLKEWAGSSKVPAGFAMFPADIVPAPREWAERFFNVQRWTEMPRGGHFAALEEPELLAQDIREFFRPLRGSN
jgi:pimeloyl-ACP methyl ester carboxylesterase